MIAIETGNGHYRIEFNGECGAIMGANDTIAIDLDGNRTEITAAHFADLMREAFKGPWEPMEAVEESPWREGYKDGSNGNERKLFEGKSEKWVKHYRMGLKDGKVNRTRLEAELEPTFVTDEENAEIVGKAKAEGRHLGSFNLKTPKGFCDPIETVTETA